MSSQPAFASIDGVHAKTADTLERLGFANAFPVQAAVIPTAIRRNDVLVQAPTGSGKTLAFGVPIIEQLPVAAKQPMALILVPTRELAVQVRDDLEVVARGKQLKCVAVFGGASIDHQARQAQRAAIVVATPGRLDDMIRNRRIDLRQVAILVLDEADRMLDMGFQPQVDEILRQMPPKRQTMLFSATLEGPVADIAAAYTNDPDVIRTKEQSGGDERIEHVMMGTTSATKVDTMLDVLADERDLAVVFVRTQLGADRVSGHLRNHGVRATAIHGGMNQAQRTREYKRFQDGACDVLVATDVFARGMDLDRITLVLNYDLPEDADTYRHRAGRTGRAGRAGIAVTMLLPKQRRQMKRMLADNDIPQELVDQMRQPSGKRWKAVAADARPADPQRAPERESRGRPERGGRSSSERGGRHDRERSGRPNERWTKPGRESAAHPARGGDGDGSVVAFDADKGFGFITPDGGGPDIFFHHKVVSGGNPKAIKKGQRVAFDAEQHERGHRAASVRLMSGWSGDAPREAAPSRGGSFRDEAPTRGGSFRDAGPSRGPSPRDAGGTRGSFSKDAPSRSSWSKDGPSRGPSSRGGGAGPRQSGPSRGRDERSPQAGESRERPAYPKSRTAPGTKPARAGGKPGNFSKRKDAPVAKTKPKRANRPKQTPQVGPNGPNRAARRAHLQQQG